MASKQQLPFLDKECEICHFGHYQTPENGQEWHVVCDDCNAIALCYEPLPHQSVFHADPHKFKMFAGGYGSGKTTTGAMETIDHIISTPGGTTLIGAETLPQLEQTAMKEFFEIFPEEWIVNYNQQKNFLDTINGHRVIFRPLDDEQKARSLELTFFWIEEANGVGYEYFVQLQTRLRSNVTTHRRGVLTTNPDHNWIKTEFLLKADKIYNSEIDYPQKTEEINKNMSVHIAPTHLNIHLPDDYLDATAQGKPEWWINRFLKGSFENKEGLVYPQYNDHIVEPFEIPTHWHRWIGADFGLQNPTAFAFLATDPETGITYVYDEYKQAQKPVSFHSEQVMKRIKGIPYNVLKDMIGDAEAQKKTAQSEVSLFENYAEYGVYWSPSTKKLQDSIMKKYSYFEHGRLKIFSSCVETIDEISQYKYPERKLDKEVKNEDIYEKPKAVNDHLMDAIRYVVAEFPDDPDGLINKSYNARFTISDALLNRRKALPNALISNNRTTYSQKDAWLNY